MSQFIDLSNKVIGEWHVIKYLGNDRWFCRCSCGKEKDVSGHELRRGATLSCGHNRLSESNLEGKVFGEWTVLEKSEKKRHYKCMCTCGTIKDVHAYSLTHGKSKSCGHDSGRLKDEIGKTYGDWEVIEYSGKGYWKCKCSCGTIRDISGTSLRLGLTKSCGCKNHENALMTRYNISGDIRGYKFEPRESWQIYTINNKEALQAYIVCLMIKLGRNVSNEEIASGLGVTRTAIYEATKKFGIDNYKPDINKSQKVKQNEVIEYIRSIYSGKIIMDTRNVISPQELDIYIPDKKIAIEFNGDYWHSELVKDKRYHQNKTLKCIDKDIKLVHIFEYEWRNKQDKIKALLRTKLGKSYNRVYARNIDVKFIENSDAIKFCDTYHLSSGTNASICVGAFYNDNIIGVMALGKPRFTEEYEYELIRLCWSPDTIVVGGTEKLFKFIINKNTHINSIVTYSDISKFTGEVYIKLGFRKVCITNPNYVWCHAVNKNVLTRYQTQKQKLIDNGFGNDNDTEADIMHRLGYFRIYDSGNIKLEWKREYING